MLKPTNTMRKVPRREKSVMILDSILDATAELFPDLGFKKTTTNKIAAKAGVSVGSVYQYFSDKESIFLALADRSFRRLIEDLETSLLDVRHASEVIEKIVEISLTHSHDNRRLLKWSIMHTSDNKQPRFVANDRLRELDWLAMRLRQLEFSDPDMRAQIMMGTLVGIAEFAILNEPARLAEPAFKEHVKKMLSSYLVTDGFFSHPA